MSDSCLFDDPSEPVGLVVFLFHDAEGVVDLISVEATSVELCDLSVFEHPRSFASVASFVANVVSVDASFARWVEDSLAELRREATLEHTYRNGTLDARIGYGVVPEQAVLTIRLGQPDVGSSAETASVSLPPPDFPMQDVGGMDEFAARTRLDELGLRVLVVREFSESVAEGYVSRQDPPPGSSVRPCGEVAIVVSKGWNG